MKTKFYDMYFWFLTKYFWTLNWFFKVVYKLPIDITLQNKIAQRVDCISTEILQKEELILNRMY